MLIAAGDWIQLIGGIVFSVGTLMIFALFIKPGSFLGGCQPGFDWRSVVLRRQLSKHV